MKFVILHYLPMEPVQVYGTFDTEDEARAYAETNDFAAGFGAYSVQEIRIVEIPLDDRRDDEVLIINT
jgi:hypothetical protein